MRNLANARGRFKKRPRHGRYTSRRGAEIIELPVCQGFFISAPPLDGYSMRNGDTKGQKRQKEQKIFLFLVFFLSFCIRFLEGAGKAFAVRGWGGRFEKRPYCPV